MKSPPLEYPGFDKDLLRTAENRLLKFGFSPFGSSLRGRLFVDEKTHAAVLLDHGICDIRYSYIRREDFDIAIEKNGESWHHPLIIGPSRYKKQLIKQNSLVAYVAKYSAGP